MSDEIDHAATATELFTRAALSQRADESPLPCGFCHYCAEPLAAGLRWCDADCRDDWQAEQNAHARAGNPAMGGEA